VATILIILVSF